MNKYFSGAIGVELTINSNSRRFNFPDVAELRNRRIKHIELCTINLSPTGKITMGGSNSFTFTLLEMNTQKELIKQMPIGLLRGNNRLYINKVMDMPRCYVETTMDVSDLIGKSLYFVFYFDMEENRDLLPHVTRTSILPIELTLSGSTTYFGENRDLIGRKIQNILVSELPYSPKGFDGITRFDNKFLTLSHGNVEFIRQVPLSVFFQNNAEFPLRIQNIQVDWTRSYIENVNTAVDNNKAVTFSIVVDDSLKN